MNNLFDCAIIGGGPAGLNAALVLGRARRNTILFDTDNPRDAVTQDSHGNIEFNYNFNLWIVIMQSVQIIRGKLVFFPCPFQDFKVP